MKIDEIKAEWKNDTKIDETDLSRESLKTPKLHSKYIDLLINAKRQCNKSRHDLYRMQNVKARYYRGELSRDELVTYELSPYQLNKPLKSEMESILDADEDCIKIEECIEDLELTIYFLESVLKSIQSRGWDIKNSITFLQFQAGI